MPLTVKCKCGNYIPIIGACQYCGRELTKEDVTDKKRVKRFTLCSWRRIEQYQDKAWRQKNDLDDTN